MSDTERRCDGCAELTEDWKRHRAGGRKATYCQRCESLRDHYDVLPAAHPQYRLLDVVDDLADRETVAETDRGDDA